MQCPRCAEVGLRAVAAAGVDVDQCPHCAGIWCDDRELQVLIDAPAAALTALARAGARDDPAAAASCPRDGGALVRMFSSRTRTVTVDACPDCQGIWVDGGELERLRAAR